MSARVKLILELVDNATPEELVILVEDLLDSPELMRKLATALAETKPTPQPTVVQPLPSSPFPTYYPSQYRPGGVYTEPLWLWVQDVYCSDHT